MPRGHTPIFPALAAQEKNTVQFQADSAFRWSGTSGQFFRNLHLFSMDDCILSFEAPKRLDKSQGTIGTVLFVPRLSLKEGIESFLLMEYYGIRADPE